MVDNHDGVDIHHLRRHIAVDDDDEVVVVVEEAESFPDKDRVAVDILVVGEVVGEDLRIALLVEVAA